MNWHDAVIAMLNGAHVQRESQQKQILVRRYPIPVYESGEEPCMLAHAWTHEETAVRVFQGASTKVLFVPEAVHLGATDWVTVT